MTAKIIINWETVDDLCEIQCTGKEIAAVLRVGYNTLERACKAEHKQGLGEYIDQKSEGGKASLRRMQWKAAQKGNPTMLIWLGKQILDQKDKSEVTGKDGAPAFGQITICAGEKPKS